MSKLFELNQDQIELTRSLTKVIQNEIGDKYISFSKYMNLALYHPQYGYYNNLLYKFGSRGDFITSSGVSKLFGFSIAKQLRQIFELGVISSNILEFGAGNGQLALDILSNMGSEIECYYIIELSASLKVLQQDLLIQNLPEYKDKVIWLTELPKEFNGIIVANEVLDALACDLIEWKDGEIFSKVVTSDDMGFNFANIKPSVNSLELANSLPVQLNDFIAEMSLDRLGFINTLSQMLVKGVILLIDYGYGESEYYLPCRSHGTLRGFFRHHQVDDVLIYPGLVDITYSIDFTSVAKAFLENQLDLLGYTTQANFLINCGIIDELEKNQQNMDTREYLQLSNGLNRLVSPNEMGEIFKVIAFGKNIDQVDYLGFRHGDKTHML